MFIANMQDDKPLEAEVGFARQREYLMRYQPSLGYFFDWLAAIYWELQGKASPFDYATRVGEAERILDKTNLEHALSSQKVLLRVVRNLFPYDKMTNGVPQGLQLILGDSSGTLRKPRFRPLQDSSIRNPDLVKQRYDVLGKAFCGQAVNLLKVLREVVDEEKIPSYMGMGGDTLRLCNEDMTELKRLRNVYFICFPEKELTSVSDDTMMAEISYKRRSELPKDMEPEVVLKTMGKLETAIRGRLQKVMIEAKNICEGLQERRKVYITELNELLTMCAAVREYIGAGSFEEINTGSEELLKHINGKFDVNLYLPADILADMQRDNKMYKSGLL